MIDEIREIGAGSPKHDPANKYEPTEPTEEELKRAGVTLVGFDNALIYLKCDACDDQWATQRPDRRGANTVAYWVCPNVDQDK
jgi:hypothetical protein